jgi:hypothetical protein
LQLMPRWRIFHRSSTAKSILRRPPHSEMAARNQHPVRHYPGHKHATRIVSQLAGRNPLLRRIVSISGAAGLQSPFCTGPRAAGIAPSLHVSACGVDTFLVTASDVLRPAMLPLLQLIFDHDTCAQISCAADRQHGFVRSYIRCAIPCHEVRTGIEKWDWSHCFGQSCCQAGLPMSRRGVRKSVVQMLSSATHRRCCCSYFKLADGD